MNNDRIYVELHLTLKQQIEARTVKRFEQECWVFFCVAVFRNDNETTL